MAIAADYELEFNGLRLGDGTDFDLVAHTGLGMPPVSRTDPLIAQQGGIHPGETFLTERVVDLVLEVDGTGATSLSDNVAALASAFLPGQPESPFSFQLPGYAGGGARRILARPHLAEQPGTLEQFRGIATVYLQLVATDPRIYADTETIASVLLASDGGGLTWPLTWPLDWGSVTSGIVSVTNEGHATTGVRLSMYGPVTNPRVENITTGETVELDLTIAAGDFVEVNTTTGVVLLNGTASRRSSLTVGSTLFLLAAGVNELRYAAQSGAGAQLGIGFRSAWFA
ncbi:MAG: hypothetical protein AAGA90_07965 [Actinomycetota bacterium]